MRPWNDIDGSNGSRVSRRGTLKAMAAAGALTGVAGCMGGDDTDDIEELHTTGPEDWDDFDGEELYIITESSSPEYQSYWQGVASRFEHVTGASVTFEFAGHGDGYRARMAELVQAGDPPEISHMPINRAATFAEQGHLADHSEVVDYWEDYWNESYEETHRMEIDGDDVYLPMHSNVPTLWRRSDVIPEAPETWEDEVQMAAEADEGEGGTRGYTTQVMIGQWQNDIMGFSRVWSNGGNLCQREGDDLRVVMDEGDNLDAWIEVMEHEQELYQYSDDNLDMDVNDMNQRIAAEMSYASHWNGSYPKRNAINAGADFAEEIRPSAPPTPDGDDLVSWGNIQGQAVFEDANTEVALEFLKFLAHPENAMGYYFADDLHQSPLLGALTEDDEFIDRRNQMPDEWVFPEDHNTDWLDAGQDLASEVNPPNEYAGEIAFDTVYARVQRPVLVDGVDPEDAIRDVADRVRGHID